MMFCIGPLRSITAVFMENFTTTLIMSFFGE